MNHHQFGYIFRGQQTDQSLHPIQHGHHRTIALLHDAKRFLKTCTGRHRRNIAPHHVGDSNLWSCLRNAAMRSCRVKTPATLPLSSITGKSCCEVASNASTASCRVAFCGSEWNSRTIALETGKLREISLS